MPITEQEIRDLQQRGFRPLFEDQFCPPPPARHFPEQLERHVIPPLKGQLFDHTKTPSYLLGWLVTSRDFRRRYEPRCQKTDPFDIQERLCKFWVQHIRATDQHQLEPYAPEILPMDLGNTYLLYILGNYNERMLRLSLVDEAIKVVMEFLEIEDQPKWIQA